MTDRTIIESSRIWLGKSVSIVIKAGERLEDGVGVSPNPVQILNIDGQWSIQSGRAVTSNNYPVQSGIKILSP